MIVSLDTSTPTCKIGLYDGTAWHTHEWEAGRTLAKELLGVLTHFLGEHGTNLQSLDGIIAYRGPGSFTGLRIGLTVLNTIADSEGIPIVGTTGSDWQEDGLSHIENDENEKVVMPEYGGDPHITTPRK